MQYEERRAKGLERRGKREEGRAKDNMEEERRAKSEERGAIPGSEEGPAQAGPGALCGLLVVDKPLGWSSMEVVRRVRRAAGVAGGGGTCIRSLARDLGVALGTGGHLASLRRLAVGEYDLAKAVNAERLTRAIGQADLLPVPLV